MSRADPVRKPAPWDRQRITDLLLQAGEFALDHRRNLERELKADNSIVTQADRDIEALFAGALERPEEGVYLIGEETIADRGEEYIERALAGTTYVIDPVDGTAPYSHGLPGWGISVGRIEAGVLTDGAVFLPEIGGGEIVISDGDDVVEGTRRRGSWEWQPLDAQRSEETRGTLIAISQDIARTGKLPLPNPVQALGSAVVPLVGLLQGRFLAYVGSLKLWDVAGCLPLLVRHRYSISRFQRGVSGEDGRPRDVGPEVDARCYVLDPGAPSRWKVRGDLLVAPGSRRQWIHEVAATMA